MAFEDCTVDIYNCDISKNSTYAGSGGGFFLKAVTMKSLTASLC